MTPKERFEALIRKEVRELLKRHVYFSREILSLACENYDLKRRLAQQGLQLKLLKARFEEITEMIEVRKKS